MGSNDHDKTTRSIYVAGASAEIETCKTYMDRLRNAGLHVTSTWPEMIAASRAAGVKSDADMTVEDRHKHALADLRAIDEADILWLITPSKPSTGAWIELGYAIAQGNSIVVSGASRGCIFAAMADLLFEMPPLMLGHHESQRLLVATSCHEEALAAIVKKWGPK